MKLGINYNNTEAGIEVCLNCCYTRCVYDSKTRPRVIERVRSRKVLIAGLLKQGASISEVAKKVGIRERTVYRYIKKGRCGY